MTKRNKSIYRTHRSAPFDIVVHENNIKWSKEFKYPDYYVCPRLGWGKLINRTMLKIIQTSNLNHFYCTCLKRIYFCLSIKDYLLTFLFDELTLDDRCFSRFN